MMVIDIGNSGTQFAPNMCDTNCRIIAVDQDTSQFNSALTSKTTTSTKTKTVTSPTSTKTPTSVTFTEQNELDRNNALGQIEIHDCGMLDGVWNNCKSSSQFCDFRWSDTKG